MNDSDDALQVAAAMLTALAVRYLSPLTYVIFPVTRRIHTCAICPVSLAPVLLLMHGLQYSRCHVMTPVVATISHK